MKEFVVGLDGSDQSRMALRWTGAVARAVGAPIRVVQSWMHSPLAVFPFAPIPESVAAMDDQAELALASAVTEILGPAPDVSTEVRRGPVVGALLQTVGPDSVLVLGSRGLGGFAGLLLGSVSQECVEYAPCPVVVVRTDRILTDGDVILVGKDGSTGARRALEWADDLARAIGASVHAVHAWLPTSSEVPPRLATRLRERAAQTVQSWTQRVSDDIGSDEVEGDPREVLVTAAQRVGPALAAVGRRGAGGVRSMRLGSTANHLVRHSATNVAVVPGLDA